jgi:mRNA-degrading endonuclease RelE of RelBE toxin-antitoxin system
MKIRLTHGAIKQYRALPRSIQKKADKQFTYLLQDIRHPSLNTKKYQGFENLWQGRIDKSYRFYFHIVEPHYIIVSIINHPK